MTRTWLLGNEGITTFSDSILAAKVRGRNIYRMDDQFAIHRSFRANPDMAAVSPWARRCFGATEIA